MVLLYDDRFLKIHELLKQYGCKPTYSCYPEYYEKTETGIYFYRTFEEELPELDNMFREEWRETVNATLDVCVQTKMPKAELGTIRFDIDWSKRVKLYSMYISLGTHSRSVSLSKNIYKTQDEVITEIKSWLKKAGCKKARIKEQKQIVNEFEQISLF